MKHSNRDSEQVEQDLAHLRQLRPDTSGGTAAAPSPPAGSVGDAPMAADTTGRAGGDPTAGSGEFGRARFDEVAGMDPDSVPRAPSGRAMPQASVEPPGTVVSPAGPLAGDLPIPPAMQYSAGPPIGPLPGQHRPAPDSTGRAGSPGQMSSATDTLAPVQPAAGSGEWLTCPECGETQMIEPAQRRAEDFCQRCDFPLFWARSAVIPLSTDDTGASLRRLPGTVGRAATASVPCPHCGEPNSPTAIICIRCSQPMVVMAPEPEPEPEPVYVPPPPEPEPEAAFPLWWVVGACVALVLITIIVAWIALAV
jgi:hypothetical protein